MARPITYSHLNVETEGVIDSPDSDPFHVFVREDHPIVPALIDIPHSISRVRGTLYPPNTHAHHVWYRVQRGVFYNTTSYMRRAYDIDEHLALNYHYDPDTTAVPPSPRSRSGSLDQGRSRSGSLDQGRSRSGSFNQGRSRSGSFNQGRSRSGSLNQGLLRGGSFNLGRTRSDQGGSRGSRRNSASSI
jgi:hypothetical protein